MANIFERKAQAAEKVALPLNPIELYQTCKYKEGYEFLRGVQEEVLTQWHLRRMERDVVCQMSTGSGKTLTGLLMLYSKLVEGAGCCLFVCPTNQLLEQSIAMASNYGIPICHFDPNPNAYAATFPAEFINRKSILLCSFHRLFNGRSIFNRDNIQIGAMVFDDAHKCVDIAREQTTIKIARNHTISEQLFAIFAPTLKEQLMGTFVQLEHGDPQMMMKVPYWIWMEKQEVVTKIIGDYVVKINQDKKNNESLKFNWNIIANNLLAYDCYIGGTEVEISPIHVPYHEITSIMEAKHRYVLSATFEDNYDLIKDLGISYNSVSTPVIPVGRKDIGKRLIIAPRRFDPEITDDSIRKFVAEYSKVQNVVVLVPSSAKANPWVELNATLVDSNNIEPSLEKLKNSKGNFMVFVNRYDGIDLHNDMCRVLIIDGIPKFRSLAEQYFEGRLEPVRASKIAQIIEQGLGRATRSGRDYNVTYLLGIDLLEFIGYDDHLSYFTPLTRAQIVGGLELLDGEPRQNSIATLKEVSDLCLSQNDGWLNYHTNNILMKIETQSEDENKLLRLQFAEVERVALTHFKRRNYEDAANLIQQEIINKIESKKTLAWYLQLAAQLLYRADINQSNNLQIKAHDESSLMFFPKLGSQVFKKIQSKGIQAEAVRKRLSRFTRTQDISLHFDTIWEDLIYGKPSQSKLFEKALAELGRTLGFNVQMPENETGNGPDCLWCMSNNQYLVLEAKSDSIHTEISRDNIEQLLHSEVWFNEKYPNSDYLLCTLQRPNKKGRAVNTTDNMKVLAEEELALLKDNMMHFARSLQGTTIQNLSSEDIGQRLIAYSLTPELFAVKYLKKIKG